MKQHYYLHLKYGFIKVTADLPTNSKLVGVEELQETVSSILKKGDSTTDSKERSKLFNILINLELVAPFTQELDYYQYIGDAVFSGVCYDDTTRTFKILKNDICTSCVSEQRAREWWGVDESLWPNFDAINLIHVFMRLKVK